MLRLPNGNPAGNVEKMMVASAWIFHLQEEMKQGINADNRPNLIAACIGKPTFPINETLINAFQLYWKKIAAQLNEVKELQKQFEDQEISNQLSDMSVVVDYGRPRGDLAACKEMAEMLTCWYKNKIRVEEKNILFTVGGLGALTAIFAHLNKKIPNGRIVTTFPFYPPYLGTNQDNHLFPIHVMEEPGYQLTAKALDAAIIAAQADAKAHGTDVSAILLCLPNNPLGTTLAKNELSKIAAVLRKYQNIIIILDEVYIELCFDHDPRISLLTEAPDLKHRIIVIRSATKALSAPGERMGVAIVFDEKIMDDLVQYVVGTCVHAPRSGQFAYACAMQEFVADHELEKLKQFYFPKLQYIHKNLQAIGAAMPDPLYQPKNTFYCLVDLSDLIGTDLPSSAFRALGKIGKIETDEDIAYSLLFRDGLMIMPLSYFGINEKSGFLRITCSGGINILNHIIERLTLRLTEARKMKYVELCSQINDIVTKLEKFDSAQANIFKKKISAFSQPHTALELKEFNLKLKTILQNARIILARVMGS